MQTRQRMILHAVLVLAAFLLAWKLVGEWKRANLRYQALVPIKLDTPAYAPMDFAKHPVTATDEIVAKNLFSPDRNSATVQAEKPEPPPPVPVVFGTMKLGDSYEALMTEGSPSLRRVVRRLKNGEQLGGYTVVEIRDEKVVVEFRGQRTTLDVYQSANSVPRPEGRTAAPAAPVVETGASAPPQPSVPSVPSSMPASAGVAGQAATAPDVRVTVEGNRRKFERDTPFGTSVWYESIQK